MTTDAQIKTEAIDWIMRLAQPENPTPETAIRFRAWLARSPRHVRAYLRYEALNQRFNDSDMTNQIDIDSLLRRYRAEASRTRGEHVPMGNAS